MKLRKGMCKILHLLRNNPRHQYRLGTNHLESSFAGKSLSVLMDTKLNMSQQCALTANSSNSLLAVLGRLLPAG